MSIGASSTPEQPLPSDTSPTTPADPSLILSETERSTMIKYLSNPQDFPQDFRGWLEGFINSVLPTSKALQVQAANIAYPIGHIKFIPDDLTAQTGVYEFTDEFGIKYLYLNGAAASQTTYSLLYAKWGANKWGADSGGNFLLPDTRGRSLWLAGTNAATDVGDNDGVSESSRQPKHVHTDTIGGSLSGSPGGTFVTGVSITGTTPTSPAGSTSTVTDISAPTGSPTAGSLGVSISGSVGTGMSGSDAVAHIVIGSLVVRF